MMHMLKQNKEYTMSLWKVFFTQSDKSIGCEILSLSKRGFQAQDPFL